MAQRVGRPKYRFPEHATPEEQMKWLRREFLKCVEKESDPKERAGLLKNVLLTLKPIRGSKSGDDPNEAYREHLARMAEAQEKRLTAAWERRTAAMTAQERNQLPANKGTGVT
jgi:hypothetical protein